MANSLDPGRVEWLSLHHNAGLQCPDIIRHYTQLQELTLFECPNVTDIAALADSGISALHVFRCNSATVEDLEGLTALQRLSLDMVLPGRTLDALPDRADLTGLYLGPTTCTDLTLDGITRWPQLTALTLGGHVNGLTETAALPALQNLTLQGDAQISILHELPCLPQVQELSLGNWENWTEEDTLEVIARRFPHLRTLNLWCYRQHQSVDLSPLRSLPSLALHIHGATQITGTEHFSDSAITRTPRPRA